MPKEDLAEFVERMESLGVTRNMPEWASYWREHATARRDGEAEYAEALRRQGGVDERRGIDPAAEGDAEENEPEETYQEMCDRLDAEDAEKVADTAREVDEEEGEGRPARTRLSTYVPTLRERREHNVTHWPFRSWCS